jgi:hypothetical protein
MQKPFFAGILAIALWSALALLSVFTKAIPPFQLLSLTFFIAGLIGTLYLWLTNQGFSAWRQPIKVWLHAFFSIIYAIF